MSIPTTPPKESRNTTAIIAAVLGVLSLILAFFNFVPSFWGPMTIIGFLLGLAAIVTGFLGIRQASHWHGHGRPMAIAGVVLGAVGAAVFLVARIAGPFYTV